MVRKRPDRLVRAMVKAAADLGVTVRWERGRFQPGQCTIDGEEVVILNKQLPPEAHLSILVEVLRPLPLDTIKLRPSVRRDIDALLEQD